MLSFSLSISRNKGRHYDLTHPSFFEAALGLDVRRAVGGGVCEIVGVDCLDLGVDLLQVAGEGVRLAGEDFSRPCDSALDASRVQIVGVRSQIVGVALRALTVVSQTVCAPECERGAVCTLTAEDRRPTRENMADFIFGQW